MYELISVRFFLHCTDIYTSKDTFYLPKTRGDHATIAVFLKVQPEDGELLKKWVIVISFLTT